MTLYKRNIDGSTQQWEVEVEGRKFRTIAGRKDGKLVTSEWTICMGKNPGKANATSSEQQAQKEAQALAQKKQDKGYGNSVDDLDSHGIVKPMLASKYADDNRKDEVLAALCVKPVFVQPKLDGVRCLAGSFGLRSRQWKPLVSAPHIEEYLQKFFSEFPDVILDGELYAHKFRYDFSQIISLARQTKPSPEDLVKSEATLEYHVYDVILPGTEMLFQDRYNWMASKNLWDGPVKLVFTKLVITEEEMDESYGNFLLDGYEGQMVRVNGPYECGTRSKYLQKRKEFLDEEFTIRDVQEGKGNRSGCPVLTIITEQGVEVNAALKCGVDRQHLIFAKRGEIIGEQATIRFQGYTKDGSLRFPVAVAVRGWY